MTRAHAQFWGSSSVGTPEQVETADVVVVGGGISGLFSTYLNRKKNVVLLEQASRLGGNAKGQAWGELFFPIGASYFLDPSEEDVLFPLYQELGISSLGVLRDSEGYSISKGQLTAHQWDGLIPKYLRSVWDETDGNIYPEIPWGKPSDKSWVRKLDKESLAEHLQRLFPLVTKQGIPPEVEFYCYSAFGGASNEISAASGLNFFAAEFGPIRVTPAGNAGFAEHLMKKTGLSSGKIRTSSLVVSVAANENHVEVDYLDSSNRRKRIQAKSAILCCPKSVVKKILKDVEPERSSAISRIRYRSYIVGAALVNQAPKTKFYDVFVKDAGTPTTKGITDVILGNYTELSQSKAVLSLYKPFPYDGARPGLLAADAYEKQKNEMQKQLYENILPALNLSEKNVVDFRMARFGHALPLSAKGFYSSNDPEILRAPFRKRVFFAEQDNWALPSLETCAVEALNAQKNIDELFGV